MGACTLKPLLAALGLYFGSLLVLRYDLLELFANGRSDLWVGYATLLVSGIVLAEIIRQFRNPIPKKWRTPSLAMTVVVGLIAFQYSPVLVREAGWSRPIAAVAIGSGETILHPSWDGHYRTGALLNGSEINLLVDTGASLVLLRYEDAVASGIDMAALDYSLPVTTAGAKAFVAPIVLPQISIGSVTMYNVRAAVGGPDLLHTSLLGMSFLENLTETIIRGDRMILRQ